MQTNCEPLFEHETIIVGTMLNHPELIGPVLTRLLPADFSFEASRGLFTAMGALFFAGAPVDRITVLAKVGAEYEAMVSEALRYDHFNSFDYYCQLLLDRSHMGRVKHLADGLCLCTTVEETHAIVDKINRALVQRNAVNVVSAHDAALEFISRLDRPEPPEYLHWGMAKLDETMTVELGDFVVIGGYPSAGKTLLSLQFACKMAKTHRVGYFSIETRTRKLIDRIFSHKAKVSLQSIKKMDFSDAELTHIADAATDFSKLHFDSIDAAGMTVREIQACALSCRHEIVFVDYLQLVADSGKSRYEKVTNISQELHTMAARHGITVIALAQLARAEKTTAKVPVPPSMSSFRESGQIEQDADVAMLLWPEDLNDNRSDRVLKIAKNKDGERSRLVLSLDGPTQTFTPVLETSKGIQAELVASGKWAKQKVSSAAKMKQAQLAIQDAVPGADFDPFPAAAETEVTP